MQSAEYAMQSVTCSVWNVPEVWNMEWEVWSAKCGVRSGVWDVEWEVGNGKRGVCSAECEV